MIDHVVIPVRDLDVSRRFYEPLFGHPGRGPDLIMQAPTLILRAAVSQNSPSRQNRTQRHDSSWN